MSQHCGEIITHVEFLIENQVKGEVFLDILKDMSWAQKCRLNTILKKLQTRNKDVDVEIHSKTDYAIKAKEERKSFRKKAIPFIAVSAAAIVATISVAVIPATAAGKNAIDTWQKRGDCYSQAQFLNSKVLKLEKVAGKINEIIKVTQQIIIDEVFGLIRRFDHTMNDNLYYNEMKGRAVINNWKKVQKQYENYNSTVRNMMNETYMG
ncbi:hypothetical protein C2G38_2087826 [Gigaspora rosea]|uniref:Uncharacterized protein n=1 Tax=Gigaspora rosea TaxID=44941 RepID=A0A397V9M8_9GLOM|nr:hypothetical protein C2G38_2087826 [Gigaspora rosea]